MSQFKSFCFTVRPLNGLQKELEEALVKWLSRYEGFLCYEMEDVARHAHGVIYLPNPRTKGDLNKSLESICAREVPNWNASQNMVLRRGTKICYNDDFISEYLSKEDNILYNNIPENTSLFYPPPEEQRRVQALSNAVDKRFHQYESDFLASKYHLVAKKNPMYLQIYIASFLEDMMFNSRKYPVIVCPKRRKELCKALCLYVAKMDDGRSSMYREDINLLDNAISFDMFKPPSLEDANPDNKNKEE